MRETRRLYWDDDGVVLFAQSAPAPGRWNLGLHGVGFPWRDLARVKAAEPWPHVEIWYRGPIDGGATDQRLVVDPEPGARDRDRIRFAAHVEEFLEEVRRRHPKRMRPGWERFPAVEWTRAPRLPGEPARRRPGTGGAYRSAGVQRPAEQVLWRGEPARRIRNRLPGALVTGGLTTAVALGLVAAHASWPALAAWAAFGASVGSVGVIADWVARAPRAGPLTMVDPLLEVTPQHLYARSRDGRTWRLPHRHLRAVVEGDESDPDRYVFGRAAELRLPAGAHPELRGILEGSGRRGPRADVELGP